MAPEPHRRLGLTISSLFNLSPSSLGRQRDLSKVMPDRVSSLLVIPPTLPHFSLYHPESCSAKARPCRLLQGHLSILSYSNIHECTHKPTHAHTHIRPHTLMSYCLTKPNHVCSCPLDFSCLWALVQATASASNILFLFFRRLVSTRSQLNVSSFGRSLQASQA